MPGGLVRGVSNLLSLLLIICLVVGASVFTSWVVLKVMHIFSPASATATITAGTAFIDPSDSHVVYAEVLVTVSGSGVTIKNVSVMYGGRHYSVTCLTCGSMINPSYPGSGNDVIYVRFLFRSAPLPKVGDRIRVILEYEASGEVKYTDGYVTITK